MKAKIHPNWYETRVNCAGCGNTFTVGGTLPEIQVEVCSNCHPFYTGQMRYVDTAGRVDRFRQKVETAGSSERLSKKEKRAQKKKQRIEEELSKPTTLKEIRKK